MQSNCFSFVMDDVVFLARWFCVFLVLSSVLLLLYLCVVFVFVCVLVLLVFCFIARYASHIVVQKAAQPKGDNFDTQTHW